MDLDRIGKISTSSIFDSESPRRNSYSQSSPDNIFLVKYVMSPSSSISQPTTTTHSGWLVFKNIFTEELILSQYNNVKQCCSPATKYTDRERERERYCNVISVFLNSPLVPPLCFLFYPLVIWRSYVSVHHHHRWIDP